MPYRASCRPLPWSDRSPRPVPACSRLRDDPQPDPSGDQAVSSGKPPALTLATQTGCEPSKRCVVRVTLGSRLARRQQIASSVPNAGPQGQCRSGDRRTDDRRQMTVGIRPEHPVATRGIRPAALLASDLPSRPDCADAEQNCVAMTGSGSAKRPDSGHEVRQYFPDRSRPVPGKSATTLAHCRLHGCRAD